jgi:hypothetical protein
MQQHKQFHHKGGKGAEAAKETGGQQQHQLI